MTLDNHVIPWYTMVVMRNKTRDNGINEKGREMLTMTQGDKTTFHVFERAGLGKAPFKFTGFEHKTFQATPDAPIQVSGSCDYCATGISDMYWILSSDGKRFKVGSTCVDKTADKGLINPMKRVMNRIKRERTNERADVRIKVARELLKASETVRTALAGEHSPNAWRAEKGETRLDWALWMMANAGRKGRLTVASVVERLAK